MRSTRPCWSYGSNYLARAHRLALAEAIAAMTPEVATAVAEHEAAAEGEFELGCACGELAAPRR